MQKSPPRGEGALYESRTKNTCSGGHLAEGGTRRSVDLMKEGTQDGENNGEGNSTGKATDVR